VQRKEQGIRAKRRAKAREKRREESNLVDELGNLKGDVGELASTAAGIDDSDGGGVGEALDQVGKAFGEIDTSGLDEPLMESESGDNEIADPVGATMAADPEMTDEMSNDPDDEILDPADADPLSVDEDGDLDELL
jgi:hypothetical protein